MSIFSKLFGKSNNKELDSSSIEQPASPAIIQVFEELDKHLRKASVSQIGGFKPPENPCASWFGGHAVKLSNETIPEYNGKKMFPLLQVNCSELPFVPKQLNEIALFVVWINQEELPFDKDHGDGWLIREYTSLDGLEQIEEINKPNHVKTFPIKWSLSETEAPGWEDAWELVDLSTVNDDDEASDLFFEKYQNSSSTKVGGYPSDIQHGVGRLDEFVFQIGSEEKANWNWVDSGIAYFIKTEENGWEFDCQFY